MPRQEETTAVLEKIKIGAQLVLDEALLDGRVDVAVIEGFAANQIRLAVQGFLWSERVGVHEYRFPRDWWQAVKERWAPAWAKKRWPVIWSQHRLEARAVFPDYRPSLPPSERHVRIWAYPEHWEGPER